MHKSLLNIVQIIGCVISTMPRRGITLGPPSGATLTHSARRPERRRFFNTHRGSLSSTACVGQERNQWAICSWLVINGTMSSSAKLLFPRWPF